MESRRAGYISRLRKALREIFARPNADLVDESDLRVVGIAIFNRAPAPVDMQLATDVTNYALMRLSFVDCAVPRSNHPLAQYCFDPPVAAAIMYRHAILKYLRLHAPMRVNGPLFEEMIIDISLFALQEMPDRHKLTAVIAYLVTVAHFYLQRGIPQYVDRARIYLGRFFSSHLVNKYRKYLESGHESFALVDIGLVRNALMAPYGGGNLGTYYPDE